MSNGYLSPTNASLPTHEASGRLVVGFSANESLTINKIVKRVPTTKKWGQYLKFNSKDYNRIPQGGRSGTKANVWANGNPRPKNTMNELGFEWQEFKTTRRNENVMLDSEAVNLASWDVMSNHTDALAKKSMVIRALEAYAVGFDAAEYPSNHVATAASLGGGFWSAGTATNPIIKISLQQAAQRILLDTNGNVSQEMIGFVVNPTTAYRMSQSQEVHSYVKESMFASDELTGEGKLNALFGLPNKLYGFELHVDTSTFVGQNRDATDEAQAFAVPDNQAWIFTREAKFEGSPETGSYSTVGAFVYTPNDMKVEVFENVEDRVQSLNVVDEFEHYMLAPESGFLVTNVLS